MISELMTNLQKRRLGTQLWAKPGANGLPDLPDLYSYYFFLLPAPKNIDVVSKIKEYLLTLDPRHSFSQQTGSSTIDIYGGQDTMTTEVSRATKPAVQFPFEARGKIEWTTSESKELWKKVLDWWENDRKALPVAESNMEPRWETDEIVSRMEELGDFLERVVLPKMKRENEDEVNNFLAFFSDTRKRGVYLTTALPYLLMHSPGEREKVTQTILDDLSSGTDKAVGKSAQAVRHWIHLADADHVEHPPDAVLSKLIERVIFRRREGIKECLQSLAFLLAEKPTAFSLEQANLIASCLVPWHDTTCLPVTEQTGDFPEEERPALRVLLGRLTSALSGWFKNNHQTEPSEIAFMRKPYRTDPLPEVRRSFVRS